MPPAAVECLPLSIAESGPVRAKSPLRVLISSLACSPDLGSEAVVGYRTIEALNRRFDVDVVTSAAMQPPSGIATCRIGVNFADPNDVNAHQLLLFERRQRVEVERRLRTQSYDLVHRVTPSGYKDSLLKVPSVPLVLGPVLGSDPPPESFRAILQARPARSYTLTRVKSWMAHGIARRVFQRFSTLTRLLENAAVIIVGTEVTRRRLPAHLHPRCRSLTYAGVEHDEFTPPAGGRAPRTPQLLFVGRLVPYKGVELLLRAAAVARRRCRFELKIVGGGEVWYRKYCQRIAETLDLSGVVTFIDRQPRSALAEMYRTADIFCMPSIETYGIAILEAMSSGCAPLVADLNGPGEIVQPGTGRKVPLQTPEQFIDQYAEEIVRLVEDARMRREIGDRAREHVVRHHDWKRIQSSLLDIYSEVLESEVPQLN